MDRIPSAMELSASEFSALRRIVSSSFTPNRHIGAEDRSRLLALGLVLSNSGGLIPTPAGKIVSRM
jgi:hypothetical protein